MFFKKKKQITGNKEKAPFTHWTYTTHPETSTALFYA